VLLSLYSRRTPTSDCEKEEHKQTDENGKPITYWGGLEKPKQETLEEAAKKQWGNVHRAGVLGFIEGAKWQQEQDKNKFSEEDMIEFAYKYLEQKRNKVSRSLNPEELLKQFKKK